MSIFHSTARTALLIVALTAHPAMAQLLQLGFSGAPGRDTPQDWKALTFTNKALTSYRLVDDAGSLALEARSSAAASGLIRPLNVDAKDYPVLRWRWRVEGLIEKSNLARKQGDDYPARIYVTFAYDPKRAGVAQRLKYQAAKLVYGKYPPHAAISYIWARSEPVGTAAPNAYTDRAHMIVVDSGSADLGRWIAHERNVYEDYRRVFGEEPPPVSGVAIMTDTDDTGETASARFAQISLGR